MTCDADEQGITFAPYPSAPQKTIGSTCTVIMPTAIELSLFLLVHWAGITAVLGQGQDLTRQPETAGVNVVLTSIALIRQTEIFSGDNLFLRRLAYAETRDGVDITTYR